MTYDADVQQELERLTRRELPLAERDAQDLQRVAEQNKKLLGEQQR